MPGKKGAGQQTLNVFRNLRYNNMNTEVVNFYVLQNWSK